MDHLVKLGDLGRVPVPQTNPMTIFFLDKLQESRKETPVKVGQEGGREEKSIRLGPGLAQEWMLTKAEGVIVGVIRSIGIGHTQLTGEQRGPFRVRLGSLA